MSGVWVKSLYLLKEDFLPQQQKSEPQVNQIKSNINMKYVLIRSPYIRLHHRDAMTYRYLPIFSIYSFKSVFQISQDRKDRNVKRNRNGN